MFSRGKLFIDLTMVSFCHKLSYLKEIKGYLNKILTYWALNVKAKTTKTFVLVDVLSTQSQSGSPPPLINLDLLRCLLLHKTTGVVPLPSAP